MTVNGRLLACAVLLAAAIALWGGTPAAAQSPEGNLFVISDRWEVQFPGSVVFDLTARSDREIVDVELRYRPLDGRVWGYGYPAFEPGQRITAEFQLNVAGAGYIAPGTRVEYYYELIDSDGATHQTRPAVLEYTDTRYEWEQTRVGYLVLLHHDIPETRVALATKGLDTHLRSIAALLRADTTKPIKGIIYNDRSSAVAAFPHQSRTITDRHVFEGFAFPEVDLFMGIGLSPRLIIHETVHVLLHRALGPSASRTPGWLDEGIASYLEPNAAPYSGESLADFPMPLESMTKPRGTPEDIHYFYAKSESVVAYLVQEYGIERFQRFLGQFRRTGSVDQALVSTYGFDTAGLEARWAVDTRGRPASSPSSPQRPSPFIYLDAWVLGGLVLIVMVAVAVRYIINRLRPKVEPEEGLQPWEDPDLLERQERQRRRRGPPSR